MRNIFKQLKRNRAKEDYKKWKKQWIRLYGKDGLKPPPFNKWYKEILKLEKTVEKKDIENNEKSNELDLDWDDIITKSNSDTEIDSL